MSQVITWIYQFINTISKSITLTNLTTFNLSGNEIDGDCANAIAESSILTNPTQLVQYSLIGDACTKTIAASSTLTHLSMSDLGDNNIGTDGVKAISESPTLINISLGVLGMLLLNLSCYKFQFFFSMLQSCSENCCVLITVSFPSVLLLYQ